MFHSCGAGLHLAGSSLKLRLCCCRANPTASQLGAAPNFPSSNADNATAMHYAVRALETYVSATPLVMGNILSATQLLQLLALHGGRLDITNSKGVSVADALAMVSPAVSPHLPVEALENKRTLQEFLVSCADQYKLHAALTIVDESASLALLRVKFLLLSMLMPSCC
jgi:hypothetical protein